MKFIALTRVDRGNEGEPVCINTDCIVAVFELEEDRKRKTRVITTDAESYFDVKENLEKIMKIIEEKQDA